MREQSTIPPGLCQCGCGERTRLAPYTDLARRMVKGEPYRFVRGHQRRKSPVEYVVDPATECWIWARNFNRRTGYGKVTINYVVYLAHRVVYERHRGSIPDGMTLDHLCHIADPSCPGGPCLHRRCVNPDHLEAVPLRENLLRGRSASAQNAAKTACKRGHPFDETNTLYSTQKRGGPVRICRICTRLLQKASRARRSSH